METFTICFLPGLTLLWNTVVRYVNIIALFTFLNKLHVSWHSSLAWKFTRLCIFQATKIHQRAFGNDHPITARSLELMATVYAEIGKTEYSGKHWGRQQETDRSFEKVWKLHTWKICKWYCRTAFLNQKVRAPLKVTVQHSEGQKTLTQKTLPKIAQYEVIIF